MAVQVDVAQSNLAGLDLDDEAAFASAVRSWAGAAANSPGADASAVASATVVVTTQATARLRVEDSIDPTDATVREAIDVAAEYVLCFEVLTCVVTLEDMALATSLASSSGRRLQAGLGGEGRLQGRRLQRRRLQASTDSLLTFNVQRSRDANAADTAVDLRARLQTSLASSALAAESDRITLGTTAIEELSAVVTVVGAQADGGAQDAQADEAAVAAALADPTLLSTMLSNSLALDASAIGVGTVVRGPAQPPAPATTPIAPDDGSAQEKEGGDGDGGGGLASLGEGTFLELYELVGLAGLIGIGVGILCACTVPCLLCWLMRCRSRRRQRMEDRMFSMAWHNEFDKVDKVSAADHHQDVHDNRRDGRHKTAPAEAPPAQRPSHGEQVETKVRRVHTPMDATPPIKSSGDHRGTAVPLDLVVSGGRSGSFDEPESPRPPPADPAYERPYRERGAQSSRPPDDSRDEGWEVNTSSDGEVYYFNRLTNETSWTRPTALRERDQPQKPAFV